MNGNIVTQQTFMDFCGYLMQLTWTNYNDVQTTKSFFDRYVSAWNPRSQLDRANRLYIASMSNPCLADTNQILSIDPFLDYEELVNVVQ